MTLTSRREEAPGMRLHKVSTGQKKVEIMHFHKLALTRGSSYNELPKWIKSKKAVINPQNKDEECFKWATIAGIHHEEIKKDHQRISRLRPHENQ